MALLRSFIFIAVIVCLPACAADEPIVRYTVPKVAPHSERMLVAVATHDGQMWTVKLKGNAEWVAEQQTAFDQLVASLGWDGQGKLTWKLPDGWTLDDRKSPNRYATLIAGRYRLETTVSELPVRDLRKNLDRWLEQLGLPPTKDDAEAASRMKQHNGNAGVVTLIDITGPGPKPTLVIPQGHDFEYDLPAGWADGAPKQFAKKTFRAGEAEVTLTDVTYEPGSVLSNLNRWRGQLKLPEWTAAEVDRVAKEVKIDDSLGIQVDLQSEDGRRIVGVLWQAPGRLWVLKLSGPSAAVEPEVAKLAEFLPTLVVPGN